LDEPAATIVRCTAFAGYALQEALGGGTIADVFRHLFGEANRRSKATNWRAFIRRNIACKKSLAVRSIGKYCYYQRGFITGMDDVFIRDKEISPVTRLVSKAVLGDAK